MEPDNSNEGHILSDRPIWSVKPEKLVGISFLITAVVAGLVFFSLSYISQSRQVTEVSLNVEQLQAQNDANPPQFAFTIVPDLLDRFSVPNLASSTAQDVLLTEFLIAQQNLVMHSKNEADAPTVYNMPVNDMLLSEYIVTLPPDLQSMFFQMIVELRAITAHLNRQLPQETLASRVGKPDELVYPSGAEDVYGQPSVYPSLRVVEAHFIGEFLASRFPTQATYYKDYTRQFIYDGVGYGYYTIAEADEAQGLVDAYLERARLQNEVMAMLQSVE